MRARAASVILFCRRQLKRMRELNVSVIKDTVAKLFVHANYHLGEDVRACLKECAQQEDTALAREVFESIGKNVDAIVS